MDLGILPHAPEPAAILPIITAVAIDGVVASKVMASPHVFPCKSRRSGGSRQSMATYDNPDEQFAPETYLEILVREAPLAHIRGSVRPSVDPDDLFTEFRPLPTHSHSSGRSGTALPGFKLLRIQASSPT